MSNIKNNFCKIIFGLAVFFLTSSNVEAKHCEGDSFYNTQIGDTVEFKQKVNMQIATPPTLQGPNVNMVKLLLASRTVGL